MDEEYLSWDNGELMRQLGLGTSPRRLPPAADGLDRGVAGTGR
jgi:hypothetical protein